MKKFPTLLLLLLISGFAAVCSRAEDITRITRDELLPMLGRPGLTVLDVRTGDDRKKSALKIRGAVWVDPDRVESWMTEYNKDTRIVVYCA